MACTSVVNIKPPNLDIGLENGNEMGEPLS